VEIIINIASLIFVSILYIVIYYVKKNITKVEKKLPDERKEIIYNLSKINIYKPMTFDSYIGQNKAKTILKNYILGTKEKNKIFPHTLLSGGSGTGKTTLARIIATELDKSLTEIITSEITDKDNLLTKIKETKGGILFLDEVHSLQRDLAETIYSMMEYFTHNGVSIEPFTLIGATTEIGEIIKTRAPFYERFKIVLDLNSYSLDDINKILLDYNINSLKERGIKYEQIKKISLNSKLNPRRAKRLLEAFSYFNGDINKMLESFDIINNGLTTKDMRALSILNTYNILGLQNIASYLGISVDNYLYDIEPFLLRSELILRTSRGRKLTDKGKITLTKLKGNVYGSQSKLY